MNLREFAAAQFIALDQRHEVAGLHVEDFLFLVGDAAALFRYRIVTVVFMTFNELGEGLLPTLPATVIRPAAFSAPAVGPARFMTSKTCSNSQSSPGCSDTAIAQPPGAPNIVLSADFIR
jgi:hypothetical protein